MAVSAERVSDAPGLGTSVSLAQSSGPVIDTWALTFTAGVLGLLINLVLRGVERRVLHWHPGQRTQEAP